jgi:hypothetical protein
MNPGRIYLSYFQPVRIKAWALASGYANILFKDMAAKFGMKVFPVAALNSFLRFHRPR